jgi:hypothetical protein
VAVDAAQLLDERERLIFHVASLLATLQDYGGGDTYAARQARKLLDEKGWSTDSAVEAIVDRGETGRSS